MVSIKAPCAALMAVVFTSACMSGDIEALRGTIPQGDAFTRTLSREYLRFVNYEWDQMDDWLDARHFARKGLKAARGVAVPPEAIGDWRLPEDAVPAIERARKRLVQLLGGGARNTSAHHAAIAQARFDCWVEQREENFQPDDIKACRDGFFTAIAAIEGANAGRLPPRQDARGRYILFFSHDRADIDGPGWRVIRAAAADAARGEGRRILVTGHADRAGPEPYNATLSLRRAEAVRAALVAAGTAARHIAVTALGESAPAVPTGDGVREPQNRRTEIRL